MLFLQEHFILHVNNLGQERLSKSAKHLDNVNEIIALFSDIPMFYIKYFTMYKVQKHAGSIRKLL